MECDTGTTNTLLHLQQVNVRRAQDCIEGSEKKKEMALLLEGKVTRKVNKVVLWAYEW